MMQDRDELIRIIGKARALLLAIMAGEEPAHPSIGNAQRLLADAQRIMSPGVIVEDHADVSAFEEFSGVWR